MEVKSMEYLAKILLHWSTIDVRTVPGVMHQILCGTDSVNDTIEYRFHLFIDCTETYVHNHRYAFDTYCLDGEYVEHRWEIVDDHCGKRFYEFRRTPGNIFGVPVSKPGNLRIMQSNRHFPGNTLHVDTNQFHSIIPVDATSQQVLTFVARHVSSTAATTTYVLSRSDRIEEPIDEPRPATPDERAFFYHKLGALQLSHNFMKTSSLAL